MDCSYFSSDFWSSHNLQRRRNYRFCLATIQTKKSNLWQSFVRGVISLVNRKRGNKTISSLKFTQGVEADKPYTYFVHIDKEITDELLESFETKVRQVVKTLSNGSTDCVVSRSKREPFLAIKVRLVSADTMLVQKNQREEDF